MTTPPDDLPRSPTGRVPQWVVDEANGRAAPTTAWRTGPAPVLAAAPRRRRVLRPVGTVLVLVAVAAGWFLTGGVDRLPERVTAALGAMPSAPPPSAEVLAVAEEAFLSEHGRELLLAARPALLDAAAFSGRCDVGSPLRVRSDAVGCYRSVDGTIVVYAPADPRLRGFVVETVAHELLHVAWTTLSADERAALVGPLEAEVAALPADDPLHAQLAGSIGGQPENRPTELFAYVGTQVWREGGLPAPLEEVYGRFVADRAALVAVHEAFDAQVTQLRDAIDAGYLALATTEGANAAARAQLDADRASVAFYREEYERQVAELAALPAQQRARLRLSWTWWDGTVLPLAAADRTLATAADLLARDEQDLATRADALAAAEATAAAERARLDGLRADYQALQEQLTP